MNFFFRDVFWYYTISTLLAIIISFPIIIIVLGSFKISPEINFNFNNFLNEFTIEKYFSIWDLKIRSNNNTFKQSLFNSLIVTGGTVTLSIIIYILGAYALSILKTPFRNLLFVLLILPFLIPIYSIIIPLYKLITQLNLNDTYIGLILIHSTSILPIGIFLMYNSFKSIPKSLREVSILNGSSEFQIITLIMLPLVIPGIVTLVIFSIYIFWNDYLLALILMNSPDMQMLNITLSKIGFRSGSTLAGYVISYIPFVLFFIFLQKFYIRGILTSSLR